MQSHTAQAPRHRKAIVFGIVLAIVAVLCGGAIAVSFFYKNSSRLAPSPLAAQDCGETSIASYDASEPFSIRVAAEGATLPGGIEHDISIGTRFAYAQWREWLGDDALRRSQINIRFLGDAQRFREIYGKPNAEEWTTTGFYRMRSNEALILYTPAYRSSALGNAFHEISHLIMARHLGATPPWLNEGIAEHYETLTVTGLDSRFAVNAQHLQLLKLQGPLSIDELTRLSRQDWMREDAQRRYASAWALIAFLMDTDVGEKTLKHAVDEAYAGRCYARRDLGDTLAQYPGGISSLQRDWHTWIGQRYSALPRRSRVTVKAVL